MSCSQAKDTIPINDAVKRQRRLYYAMEAAAKVAAQLQFIQKHIFPGNQYGDLIWRAKELSNEINVLYQESKEAKSPL